MRAVKLFTGIAGVVAVAVAVPLLIAGTAMFAWAAGDDQTQLPSVFVTEDDTAVSAEVELLLDNDDLAFRAPFMNTRVEATGSKPLFIGVGARADVNEFLANGGVPVDEDFWAVADQGQQVVIDWDPPTGDWAVVLMNADGTPGIDATITASLPAAPVRVFGGLLGLFGLGLGTVGVVLIVSGWGAPDRRHPAPVAHSVV